MQRLRYETITEVMRLPEAMRMDLLEFIGSTQVSDTEVQRLVGEFGNGADVGRGRKTIRRSARPW